MPHTHIDPLQSASDRLVEVLAMLSETRERMLDMRSERDTAGFDDCMKHMIRHVEEGISMARSYVKELSRRQDLRQTIRLPKPPPWTVGVPVIRKD
jgi:hypothetical protein